MTLPSSPFCGRSGKACGRKHGGTVSERALQHAAFSGPHVTLSDLWSSHPADWASRLRKEKRHVMQENVCPVPGCLFKNYLRKLYQEKV